MVWVLALVGVGFWAVLIACSVLHRLSPSAEHGCGECGHDAGLAGTHCSEQDDNNGWSSDLCRCQNDYHWRFESVTK